MLGKGDFALDLALVTLVRHLPVTDTSQNSSFLSVLWQHLAQTSGISGDVLPTPHPQSDELPENSSL